MYEYKTVEEKALEWNVTPRHVQYLCRIGKIENAMKRAGSWFIPDGTPIPVKNTKANTKDFMFVGTKSRIFDSAIELFMLKDYGNVSLRDIAGQVGIRQSTIYNHFKSKQEILDAIYDFYCYYYLKDRPSLEEMEPLLQKNSLMEIFILIRYEFKGEYLKKLSDITKIIFQRMAIDDRAREICKSLIVDEGVSYVEKIFTRLAEIGRFTSIDAHSMAVFINGVRIFTLYNWIVDPAPENIARFMEDEMNIYKHAVALITD